MNFRITAGYCVLAVLLLIMVPAGLMIGSTYISPEDIIRVFFGDSDTINSGILLEIRLPRVIAAVLLGGGLSVSGLLLQSFFANPIAGPFVLGISSGAKLSVALLLVFALKNGIVTTSWGMIAAAFAGALASTGFVLLISGKVRNMSYLVVCGIMIGYICSAVTDFVVTFADDADIVNLHNWSLGSFSGISLADIPVMASVICVITAAAFMLSKPMGAYLLGESYALSVGINVKAFRFMLILLSSGLSACVTAFAGPIAFVGIAVPHMVRSLFGKAKPLIIMPACFLAGSAFCLFCDLIARMAFAPVEMSISSVTSLLGAPAVIWLMINRRR